MTAESEVEPIHDSRKMGQTITDECLEVTAHVGERGANE